MLRPSEIRHGAYVAYVAYVATIAKYALYLTDRGREAIT